MNSVEGSPFFNRIKLYGGSYSIGQSPPLSQATMVKSIVDRISENSRSAETDRYAPRKSLLKRTPGSEKLLIFRKYYALNQDSKISDIYYYYFSAVKNVFKSADGVSFWSFEPNSNKAQNILQTTAGYFSLIQILEDIFDEISEEEKFDFTKYEEYLVKASGLKFDDQQRYPFTTKSRSILYLDISLKIWPASSLNDDRLLRLQELLKEAE